MAFVPSLFPPFMFSLGGTDTIIAVTSMTADVGEETLSAAINNVLTANLQTDVTLTAEIVQVTSAVMQSLTLTAEIN